jgi:hypothetical protein
MPSKSFFLFADALLFDKISADVLRKPLSVPIWETPNRPPNKKKCELPVCFGDRNVEKEGGLRTHNLSAEEVGGLTVFLY